jgi:hypothetical protein
MLSAEPLTHVRPIASSDHQRLLHAFLCRTFAGLVRKQSESKLSDPFQSNAKIGAVRIPFPSRRFYNRLANRLASRVCLDEETLVALLSNFD